MPRLKVDPGDLGFIRRVAQDKPVVRRVFKQPFCRVGLGIPIVQPLVGRGYDVCCKPGLMLAPAGIGDQLRGSRDRLILAVAIER